MADRPEITIDQHQEQTALALDDVTARVTESGVEHVYYQFVTLSGRVMAKVVPAAHLARNLEKGVQFHGSAITDLVSDRHGNLIASGPDAEEFLALPDASTFAVLPWAPNTGRFFCNLYRRRDAATDPGAPLATCVRTTLRDAHEQFRHSTGLELRSGCEPEMSCGCSGGTPSAGGGSADPAPSGAAAPLPPGTGGGYSAGHYVEAG